MQSISESSIANTQMPKNVVNLPQKFSDLQTTINALVSEANKYGTKQTKVGATRLRKNLMSLSKACKDSRVCILKETKEMPKIPRKSKVKKVEDEDVVVEEEDEVEEEVEVAKAKKGKKSKAKK